MDCKNCTQCRFGTISKYHYPCNKCDGFNYFKPKQLTIPKIPPVIPRKIPEEINHPQRYAGGKYECIDVMTDVFGVDAVRNFCKLNAFKYLWREQQKNGIEDLKKCAWYINKFIELTEGENNEKIY